jgi:signal transduction histidine kinase
LPETSPGRQVLKEVQDEILHIKKILSDLLEYARPRQPDFHQGDLNATIERAVTFARQQVLSQPIQIEFVRNEELPPIEHDPAQIQQVLLNLLLNAIQALNGKGQVRVELEMQDTSVLTRVKDNGRGIGPEALPNIFRPFFTTKGQGTGLGLSLARRIVESHGGTIEADSAPGQGTEFKVWLPTGKAGAKGKTS